ncbi:MAG: hypothetical protein AMK69_03800 [Nitrospira bacterium SG8_3]|nr:MAG: hypothetical protein AMK69_03800 [Nitrospira bacterium SG8_3]
MINVKLIIRYWILDTRYWMNKAGKFSPIFNIQHPVSPPASPERAHARDGGQAASSIRCSELTIMLNL